MKVYAIWTTDDEFSGSIKLYCVTRKLAIKHLKDYRDWYCNKSPKPDNKHILEIDIIED